ncbi:hypothetical protein HLB44_11600 [Aquincola sp. S2]|uniref:DUF3311 domain-containing protein n=1 Tax=Pseudaquabacterium terrae TaxID=2732868 RepID=A0ABX2EG98_9BURK|nr:hypothetical protein [Aquabacterium terrae]NRF67630.1 hypothetical protein [Aquabacterium terrae]
MSTHRLIKAQRLVALFVFGCLMFSYPLLSLFNVGGTVLGIPLLYAYLFAVWALLIVLMILAVERGS